MGFISQSNAWTRCIAIIFPQTGMTELTLHPRPVFNVLQMPHESFMTRHSMNYSPSSVLFVLAVFELISSREADHLKQTQNIKNFISLLVNVFSIVSWQGQMSTSTFPALRITKSSSVHNIWYALTLMLELIIPPVCHHFNTSIRIHWNFMNAVG